jgi:hypothetical protein
MRGSPRCIPYLYFQKSADRGHNGKVSDGQMVVATDFVYAVSIYGRVISTKPFKLGISLFIYESFIF